MHTMLFTPAMPAPITRPPRRAHGSLRFPAWAVVLLMALGSVLPGFGQTWIQNLTGINGPTFVALDTRAGTTWLYVSEHGATSGSGGGRILRFNATTGSGTPQVVATAGTADGQFTSPDAILVDAATGDLFIADRAAHRVQRIAVSPTTGAGTFVMKWGQNVVGAADELQGPLGLARDGSGAIYVTEHDTTGNRVSKYTLSGTAATRVWRIGGSGTGNGQFSTPYGIAVSGSNLLISDGFNNRVQTWNLNGVYQSQFSVGSGVIPLGLFVDSAGALWVAEANAAYTTAGTTQRIMKRTLAGAPSGVSWGTQGSGPGQFSLPFHAVVNDAGTRAYVADYGNNRVQVFDLAGGVPDTTPPTVASFTIAGSTAASVTYQIVFSEAVTGVNAADFAAIRTGSTGGTATVGAVSGSGTTYTIPVSFTGTGGSVQLNLNASGTGIQDAAMNAIVGGATGPVHTVVSSGDTTAPTVASFTFATATSTTGSFTLTFSESVTGVTTDDFYSITTGNTSATITSVTGSGSAYTVNFAYSGNSGALQLRLRATGTGITDAAGNAYAGGGAYGSTVVPNAVGTGDTAAPTVTAFTAGTGASGSVPFTVTFNEAVSGVTPSVFTATGAGASIASVISTGTAGTTYVVNVNYTGTTGTVTLALNSTANTSVRDFATNPFAGGGTTSATFTVGTGGGDTTPPAVSSFTIASSNASSVTYQLVFSEAVTGVNAADFAATRAGATGAASATVGTVTGSGTTYTIPIAFTGTGGTVVLSLNSSGTGIQDTAGNALVSGATGPTFTVPGAIPVAPVVTAATVTGTVGLPLSYQIVATGNPTGYAIASGTLPAGLALAPSAGTISGTPSAASSGSVTVTATNAVGTSAPATLTFAIGSVPPPPPPPPPPPAPTLIGQTVSFTGSNLVPGVPVTLMATATSGLPVSYSLVSGSATLVGNVLTATSTGTVVIVAVQNGNVQFNGAATMATFMAREGQTLTFNSPVSAIIINQPLALSASSSANLPVTFSVVSGNAEISGNTLIPRGPAPIVVRATQAGNSVYAATSTDVNFGSPQRAAQSINFGNISDLTVTSGPVTLAGSSSSGLPITYTVSGPATLVGNLLAPTGVSGTVTVRARQTGNDSYNPAAEVIRTFTIRAIGQQVYLGSVGSNSFAAAVSADNTAGVFIMRLASNGHPVVVSFDVEANGAFRGQTTTMGATYTVAGTVINGVMTGTIAELGQSFTANVQPPTGTTAALAGAYQANVPGSASGSTYIVAGPNGQAFAVAMMPSGAYSGMGTISPTGAVTVPTSGGGNVTANVNASTGGISGTVTAAGTTSNFLGLSRGTDATDRFANLSSRLRVTAGDASRSVIVGFVVTGTESRSVLIRAVGPGLRGFGISGVLNNPRLQLYRGSTLIAENEDWNDNADVRATGDRVGAFRLGAGSQDAAFVTSLQPGAYTVVIVPNGGSGVALIEVYDAATGAALDSRQLVNISTRGYVDTGDGQLIAGFVVSGNAPKRVLIRGIGPSLTQFGVPNAVADPMLMVYTAGSTVAIAQNNNWGTAMPINASQTAATAAEITVAATAAGAFPLAAGSLDAAVIITLPPGAYSAVVGGANNGTGAGLIEVYEIPNL